MPYRITIHLIVLALIAALAASCTQQSATPQNINSTPAGEVIPVFAFSEAVVGPNRLAIGLMRAGSPLNDPGAQVQLRFFDLNETNPQPKLETSATYYGQGLPAAVYVAYATFDKPGNWGVEIQATLSGQTAPSVRRYSLEVRSESAAPLIGQAAISTKTLTINDVPDPAQLTSGPAPDPALYQISLDQALATGKPVALLFATPNFCKTATCGPSVTVLSALQKTYGDRMIFIHSEVYRFPFGDSAKLQAQAAATAQQEGRPMTLEEQQAGFSDAMAAWNLPSEPWLFLIDAKGAIAARYEGGITSEELTPAIEKLLAGQPVLQ